MRLIAVVSGWEIGQYIWAQDGVRFDAPLLCVLISPDPSLPQNLSHVPRCASDRSCRSTCALSCEAAISTSPSHAEALQSLLAEGCCTAGPGILSDQAANEVTLSCALPQPRVLLSRPFSRATPCDTSQLGLRRPPAASLGTRPLHRAAAVHLLMSRTPPFRRTYLLLRPSTRSSTTAPRPTGGRPRWRSAGPR